MPILVNIQKLRDEAIALAGEIPLDELDFASGDELIFCSEPLRYDLTAEYLDDSLLVRGKFSLPIECECVRCLSRFETEVSAPDWAIHLPLKGDDAAPIKNDCVDLTPYLREDTLLRLPPHPLCRPDCDSLPATAQKQGMPVDEPETPNQGSAAWTELDKLKLD